MKKIFAIIVLAFGVLACQPKSELTPFKLTISYIPNIQFTPFYVGQAKGFFAEEGIDLHIDYAFGADIASLLMSGKIDAGLADSDQLLLSIDNGLDLVAFRSYYQAYPLSIITLNDSLTTPQDLSGKIIGVPELFGSSYLALQDFLYFNNLTDKVTIERIGYNQISMLENGDIDAAVTFVNNENIILKQNHPTAIIWPIADYSNAAGAALITSRTAITSKEALFKGFKRALDRSIKFIEDSPEDALDIAIKTIGAQPSERDFLRKSLNATLSLYSADGLLYLTLFESTYNQLVYLNFIKGKDLPIQNYLVQWTND